MNEHLKAAMKHEPNYFTSLNATRLFYNFWRNESSQTCLIIVHGFGEHSGRYQELVNALLDLKLNICTFDLRGHGRSEGKEVFVNQFCDFKNDLLGLRRLIQSTYSINQFILFGHSMGGLIALDAMLAEPLAWQRLMLSSPFLGIPFGEPLLRELSRILNLIVPGMVWDNPVPPIGLTHDKSELEVYSRDALIRRRITIRLAHEMFQACRSIRVRANEITKPLFVMSAGQDRVVSLKRTQELVQQVRTSDKEFHVFDGFYHEILHEVERKKVIQLFKSYLIRSGL